MDQVKRNARPRRPSVVVKSVTIDIAYSPRPNSPSKGEKDWSGNSVDRRTRQRATAR